MHLLSKSKRVTTSNGMQIGLTRILSLPHHDTNHLAINEHLKKNWRDIRGAYETYSSNQATSFYMIHDFMHVFVLSTSPPLLPFILRHTVPPKTIMTIKQPCFRVKFWGLKTFPSPRDKDGISSCRKATDCRIAPPRAKVKTVYGWQFGNTSPTQKIHMLTRSYEQEIWTS